MTEAAEGRPTVARSATGMGAAAAASRVIGGLRVLVIAAVLGTTYLGNAFQSANSVSNLLFELLAAGALSAVLVPTFVSAFDSGDDAGATHLAGELLALALVVLGVVSVIGMLAAPWIADLLTSAVTDPTVAAQQQDLTTFLLWFFIPQVVLYGVGAIAIALLNARRRFLVPALAPIGNTVVMVAFLFTFAAVAGPDPGLELDTTEKLLLAAAGTLGVVAFVAAPTVAVWRDGVRLWPRWSRTHDQLGAVLKLSGWATVQHACAAVLMGAAIIAGGAVAGGVVAYQVGWFFFLAPYGIIAQPIHTTILPELVAEHGEGRTADFTRSVVWALDSMVVILVPLSALCVVLAVPAMSVLAFGSANEAAGVELLAAAFASLALGMVPYGAFFLYARAHYVLGDSRTPAILILVAAVLGSAAMFVAMQVAEGWALVFGLGAAHSAAFLLATVALVVSLHRGTGHWALPTVLGRCLLVAVPLAALAWVVHRWWDPVGKAADMVFLAVVGGGAILVYLAAIRAMGMSLPTRALRGGAPS